jgi:membrane-bound lytic murein transglycosylase D
MQLRPSLSALGILILAGTTLHPATTLAQASPGGAPGAPASEPSHATVIPAGAPKDALDSSGRLSRSEVSRRAVEVFGDSLILLPPPVLDSSVAEPTWDMDVRSYETQERVAHYVSQFTGRSKSRIAERLEVGSRYEPMIRARMKAGGLPEDMYYLALIESGFDNNAYSRAAAVGMWQFMTSTARGMGMRVDWWIDERRDPVKATGAAVRFIRGMRDQFGSLYLAAAAYNGGPGRVARGLARYADDLEGTKGDDAFFVLAEKDYLHNETREYVPQLIAAALIAKEPKRYGMTLTPREPFAYDSVKVPAATPLAAIAKASNSTVAVLRELNPHILRGMTPPRVRFQVRIPVGSAADFDSSFAALPKTECVATKVVESRKGNSVDGLAEKNGISSAALIAFNPKLRRLKPSGRLVPGQAILIPAPAVARAALNVPDPSIEKYAKSSRRMKLHTVKRGETVGSIARKYDTSSERIMRLNGLRKPMIFPGQSLIVKGSVAGAKARKRKA